LVNTVCRNAIVGTVANGGACYTALDCSAGSCDTSSACPGACVAFIAVGQSCAAPNSMCAPGLICDGASTTCKAQSAAGGACPCQAGTYCDGTSQLCIAKKTSGACTSGGSECAISTVCSNAQCTPYQAVGGACTPPSSSDQGVCGLGSFCDPATNLCAPWPVIGQSCAVIHLCQTGFCDQATSMCLTPKGPGATCAGPQECQGGDYCDLAGDKTCKVQKANGATCSLDFECQTDSCKSGVCAVGQTTSCAEK